MLVINLMGHVVTLLYVNAVLFAIVWARPFPPLSVLEMKRCVDFDINIIMIIGHFIYSLYLLNCKNTLLLIYLDTVCFSPVAFIS